MKKNKKIVLIFIFTILGLFIYMYFIYNNINKYKNEKDINIESKQADEKINDFWKNSGCTFGKPELIVNNIKKNIIDNYKKIYVKDSLVESFYFNNKKYFIKQTSCDEYDIEFWIPIDKNYYEYNNKELYEILYDFGEKIKLKNNYYNKILDSIKTYKEKILFDYENFYEKCKFDGRTCLESFGVFKDKIDDKNYLVFRYKSYE